jgi:hypothetical protein
VCDDARRRGGRWYEIETITGTLVATVPSPDPDRMLPAGTNVRVTFDESRSYVLRKE